MQTAHRQDADATEIPADPLKAFIQTRLARNETPRQIADAVRIYLRIAIDPAQVIPYWKGEITLPTQTEHRPDKESVQIPADEVKEPTFTRMADGEAAPAPFSITPDPGEQLDSARGEDASPTQTERRQDEESLQIPADAMKQPAVLRVSRDDLLDALAGQARARLGIAPDPAPAACGTATQTGRRRNRDLHKQEPGISNLTDEIKAFIVKGLARYDTPSQVAEAVREQFGIAVSRQQVFAYDPAGSRPPATRWVELHAATREKFLRDLAEIGVAQKAVRLRMLDRYARRAEANNFPHQAAEFLVQAAKECGGIYESRKSAPPPKA